MRKRFEEHPKPQWDGAVLCFRDSKGSSALVQHLGAIAVGYKVLWGMEESTECPFVHEACIGGKRIGIISRCVWGGPQAALLVEELATLGATYLIGFGAAGSIIPDLKKGTQVVASSGIVTDGTSRAYTSEQLVSANAELSSAVQVVSDRLGIPVAIVRVATVDAVYRETDEAVQLWLSSGAQAINMETTPFYAASAVCGIPSVWVGHISDCLVNREWDTWERSNAMSETTIRIIVGLLEHLAQKKTAG